MMALFGGWLYSLVYFSMWWGVLTIFFTLKNTSSINQTYLNNVLKSIFFFILAIGCIPLLSQESAKRLFCFPDSPTCRDIDPEGFTPLIEKAYGKENVIILQHAIGGNHTQMVERMETPDGNKPEELGDIYDDLIKKTIPLIKGEKLESICFIWMQGERDARMGWGNLYEDALFGLHAQLARDLQWKPEELIFVIGRLSDFDLENKKYSHWTKVRGIQSKVTAQKENWHLVNTDDLNDRINRKGRMINNDLHYSADGYKILGQRFAKSCIEAISNAKQP